MSDAIINGKCYDWSDITIDLPGAEGGSDHRDFL